MVGSQAGQPLHCRFVEGEPGDGSYSVSERASSEKKSHWRHRLLGPQGRPGGKTSLTYPFEPGAQRSAAGRSLSELLSC